MNMADNKQGFFSKLKDRFTRLMSNNEEPQVSPPAAAAKFKRCTVDLLNPESYEVDGVTWWDKSFRADDPCLTEVDYYKTLIESDGWGVNRINSSGMTALHRAGRLH